MLDCGEWCCGLLFEECEANDEPYGHVESALEHNKVREGQLE